MKAKLFDGFELEFSGSDVESIDIEYGDYSLLITFNRNFRDRTGYAVERAEWISI